MPRWGLLVALVVLLSCLGSAAAEGVVLSPSAPYAPRTSRRYTMMVEALPGSLDEEGDRPTLVSVTDEMSLTLPAKVGAPAAWEGDAEGSEIDESAAARLTFDENFDPIWYYVLRRRGFEHLDWSGCGGKWRPEWSLSTAAAAGAAGQAGNTTADAEAFRRLHHYLAHHAVCTYSSVSFCGASRERDAASQFQWAAQFISTLTSSPLSWTDATPRHQRPNGVVLQQPSHNGTAAAPGEPRPYWCSYHLVYHDTLCTQHVSPLLNGGRSGRGVQEGLPHGIFRAVFPSFVGYFNAPFQHFTVKATQQRRPAVPAAGTPPTVQLRVEIRMTMVVGSEEDLQALSDVWTRELPAYARGGRLQVRIGPGGLSRPLRAALRAAAVSDAQAPGDDEGDDVGAAAAAADSEDSVAATSPALGRSPEVQYQVHTNGKDYGYLTVTLQPALALLDAHSGVEAAGQESAGAGEGEIDSSAAAFGLQEGDVVRTLLLFPLHLVRPSLYNMESLLGTTRIVHAHTDVVSNTLAVLLETRVTAVHGTAYDAAFAQSRLCLQAAGTAPTRRCKAPAGVLLGRFRLFFGWAALSEMPPDDNSNRLVPQPVVAIHRAASSAFCQARQQQRLQGDAAASVYGVPQLDHEASLAAVFELLNGTSSRADAAAPATGESCVYWVRSTVASGTTIPGPDGAMVFNVLSLGLVFSAIGAGMLTRVTRRLTYRREDLAAALA